MRFCAVVLTSVLSACGSSSSSEDGLDIDLVALSPTPGTYENGVVLSFKTPESSWVEVQENDGSWVSKSELCLGGISTGQCMTVNETKTFKYRLTTFDKQSAEKEAAFMVTPKQNDLVINSKTFTESQTECYVSTSGTRSLKARVKLANDTVLGSGKVLYLLFTASDVTKINQEFVVSDSTAGFTVAGSGDSASSSATSYYKGLVSGLDSDNCKLTLKEFTAGQKATGTISCQLSFSGSGTQPVTLKEDVWV